MQQNTTHLLIWYVDSQFSHGLLEIVHIIAERTFEVVKCTAQCIFLENKTTDEENSDDVNLRTKSIQSLHFKPCRTHHT